MRHLMAFSPLEIVAIDFVKLDKGKGGYEDVLVITDVYTKWLKLYLVRIKWINCLYSCRSIT